MKRFAASTVHMWPRKRFDLSLGVLVRLMLRTGARDGGRAAEHLRLYFGEGGRDVLPFLSVRSALDALLTALALPAGSEVLMSALTIPDMDDIVRAHGLMPVGVDIDAGTLAPDLADARRKTGALSRAFLFAHLFGAVSDVTPLARHCRAHGLLLIEDCAQAFAGRDYVGHPASDVVLWSFGPLKTATALVGAVAAIDRRRAGLASRMARVAAAWPVYPRRAYARRVLKLGLLHLLATPWLYGLLMRGLRAAGRDPDALIRTTTRSFPRSDLLTFIRRQPGAAVVSAMAWRLWTYPLQRVERREEAGRRRLAALGVQDRVPGRAAVRHTFWLFPVAVADPAAVLAALRAAGVDAARVDASLACVDAEPAVTTPRAHRLLANAVHLPHDDRWNSALEDAIRRAWPAADGPSENGNEDPN